jgi:hypothetical protein
MNRTHSWILTDSRTGLYVEHFHVTHRELGVDAPQPWSIEKRRLKGGLCDGVDVVEIVNGPLSVAVCPTRGMGVWRGSYQGWPLGWRSPVQGPVHPGFVNRDELGGVGWLAGFDEWIVRCGLNNNGAPAVDRLPDNTGAEQSMALPLHGRIANIPAHYVEVRVETTPPYGLAVFGQVDESTLFFPQLRLDTEIRTTPGSNRLLIRDRVTNLKSLPAELELLYHCNFGPPLLGEGARFRAPVGRVAPINKIAQDAMEAWDVYPGPTPGVVEQCYLMQLLADPATDRTLALLEAPSADKACALRFSRSQLPWFTLWKNPAALSDGYVTGLEPGTDLPNAKPFERLRGRVVQLPPQGAYDLELVVEVADDAARVAALADEVARLQSLSPPRIDRLPPEDLAPV